MVRQEFIKLISQWGGVSTKDLKVIMRDKEASVVSELTLLTIPTFDDVKFARDMAQSYKLKYMDLQSARLTAETFSILKRHEMIRMRAIPIQRTNSSVMFAIYDPTVIDDIKQWGTTSKIQTDIILTNLKSWSKIFNDFGQSVDELITTLQHITVSRDDEDSAPSIRADEIGEEIINMVNKILVESYVRKASDIHIEPYQKIFRIRLRIDGNLIILSTPPQKFMLPIISRFKIMSQMDIAERRRPQDGRLKIRIGDKELDYRVSSLPTLYGEKIVLRLLDKSNLQLDMTKLGFEPKQLEVFKEAIHRPYGMCLVTGPTGSGKTTTLYSALADLNTTDANISTAEDPVEFDFEGINQVSVRKDIGYTFASALKSFLRQDPDIIMVGEIRDIETAEMAIEAALTGHMVLSTLHTNDAPSTITRLLNMGLEPFLIVGALNVVVAQRLCRKICMACRDKVNVSPETLVSLGIAPASAVKMSVYKGTGCNQCNGTGYRGRLAIYEVMAVSLSIKELVIKNASAEELKRQAIREGMKTLRMAALTKVAMGLTTLEEAISNSGSDN